jgi:hypothetical protein
MRPHDNRADATTTTPSFTTCKHHRHAAAQPLSRRGDTPAAAKKHSLIWRDEHAAHQRPRATPLRSPRGTGTIDTTPRTAPCRSSSIELAVHDDELQGVHTTQRRVMGQRHAPAALLSSAILHNFCKRQTGSGAAGAPRWLRVCLLLYLLLHRAIDVVFDARHRCERGVGGALSGGWLPCRPASPSPCLAVSLPCWIGSPLFFALRAQNIVLSRSGPREWAFIPGSWLAALAGAFASFGNLCAPARRHTAVCCEQLHRLVATECIYFDRISRARGRLLHPPPLYALYLVWLWGWSAQFRKMSCCASALWRQRPTSLHTDWKR